MLEGAKIDGINVICITHNYLCDLCPLCKYSARTGLRVRQSENFVKEQQKMEVNKMMTITIGCDKSAFFFFFFLIDGTRQSKHGV